MTLARVRQLPGLIQATGDLSTRTLVVTYDPDQVAPEEIVQAVEESGHRVEGTFAP